jgi:hypothetical protein
MPKLQRATKSGPSPPGQETEQQAGDEVNLKALAERVYKLLKKEARIERQRLGKRRR